MVINGHESSLLEVKHTLCKDSLNAIKYPVNYLGWIPYLNLLIPLTKSKFVVLAGMGLNP